MTRNQEIEELLAQLPDRSLPEVIHFLRVLASRQWAEKEYRMKASRRNSSIARRSFNLIPADAAMVREALSEDLYGLE
ncbi:MAG TPA: hypothetical protein VNN73_12025 [Blastocatellia bacterium]|nr:hypothetical protein [Blastocatellia bacterium]